MAENAKRNDHSPLADAPRKRAKYTQVACVSNECKRRKLKCSGGEICMRCSRNDIPCIFPANRPIVSPSGEVENERQSSQFQKIDQHLANLQQEIRTISGRLHQLESSSPLASSKPSPGMSTGAHALQRILNPPKSPTFVGPTSAEFGLGQQQASLTAPENVGRTAGGENEPQDSNESTPAPLSLAASSEREGPIDGDPLKALGLEETLRLVQVYEDAVGIMYPCVDLTSLRTYVVQFYHTYDPVMDKMADPTLADSDQDWFHARDVQVLKILCAIALLVESHGRSERAAQLADSVEDRFASRLKIADVDMKEILLLVLLSIFHSYRDDEVIAWRLTGMAARGCMELGLHFQETWQKAGGVFPGALEWMWASRLFWCIYVLDRKWSFGTGLPFAIQDSDMDTDLPEPGHSTPYLMCMISYARLGAKIWGLVIGWSRRSHQATSESCAILDAEVQKWVHSIPQELRFDPNWRSPSGPEHTDRTMMLQVLLALQANQLRILVYRQNLLNSERIAENVSGASIAVETAKKTIHMLDYFSRVSNIYFQRPEPFNYFLISAMAALLLGVRHAPGTFSQTCRPEFYIAVDMVRRSATRARTSRRLQKIIRSLKRIQSNFHTHNQTSGFSSSYENRAYGTPADTRRLSSWKRGTSWYPSDTTPVSSVRDSPMPINSSFLPQSRGKSQPSSTSLWPLSPGTAADAESHSCEDLSSFFEYAGDLYFDPGAEMSFLNGVNMGVAQSGDSRLPTTFGTLQDDDQELTRVMAGLL
ncbi:hypothetical protein N7468_002724 [Penicillium chermesinum]|uniref:Xylanolytic transcriptional activator regulatory domain-containing protein n=1 Tax=Penicillium chermesinum TaxID=63820 RepID=A0A9W9PJ18_9EURO|nr:uncharacterized protein N7468_002724 [Penicillium chermesinum]KAJ5247741.1 hypothetical protein N7468_002724 [Penicillium chermesinum]